jgi:hypothetical protein
MTLDEAKHNLLMHGSGTYSASGQSMALDDGFLGSLRPYRGLQEKNFHLVMEALFVWGEQIRLSPHVDRSVVESLWSMCALARYWGVSPTGMLQRNRLITESDAKRIEMWIDTIERTAWGFLRGNPPEMEVERYANYVASVGWWENIDFFIPFMLRGLEDPELTDPSVLAEAFGKLGTKGQSALPLLYRAEARTYSFCLPADICTEEVREIVRRAIESIENAKRVSQLVP